MKCNNCGDENPEGKKFCGNCGAALALSAPAQPGGVANPGRKGIYLFGSKIPPLLLAPIPVLCICVCLAVFLATPSKPSASLPTETSPGLVAANRGPLATDRPVNIVTPAPSATATVLPTSTAGPKNTPTVARTPTAPPKQSNTPKQTSPPRSTSTPTRASPPAISFGDGMKIVGADIPPGTYRGKGSGSCYWERLSGFGGTLGEIIANDDAVGPSVVTIAGTDKGFNSSRCGTWTQDLSPITSSPTVPFGDGTFIVNKDIAPGTWRSSSSGSCYWERLRGFGGTLHDIIANDNTTGGAVVTIAASDAGFSSSRCGTWTKVK